MGYKNMFLRWHACVLTGVALFLTFVAGGPFAWAAGEDWQVLEQGVEKASFVFPSLSNSTSANYVPVTLAALRLDPYKVDFDLLMASELGKPRTLLDWSGEYGLIAAINASMYLPDRLTSTGYMRRDEHANNSRVVNSFGAFFVAGPDSDSLPPAAVLDRKLDDWENLISHYKIVIQNFRMMTPEGVPLWGGTTKMFSIAAVAQDNKGNILFLHTAQPMTVNEFVNGVMSLGLNIDRLMYVEGGHQAAMLVNAGGFSQVWTGRLSFLVQDGNLVSLPNVLGVKRRKSD